MKGGYMQAFEVINDNTYSGILVVSEPYPHIVLGKGGRKRDTWVGFWREDESRIVQPRIDPCPDRNRFMGSYLHFSRDVPPKEPPPVCTKCGAQFEPWKFSFFEWRSLHPDTGTVQGPACVIKTSVRRVEYRDGRPSTFKLAAPESNRDNRALVLWRVMSGNHGTAEITPDPGAVLVAKDEAWHSARSRNGLTAEVLAMLKPGQFLQAVRSGTDYPLPYGLVHWDGLHLSASFGRLPPSELLKGEISRSETL